MIISSCSGVRSTLFTMLPLGCCQFEDIVVASAGLRLRHVHVRIAHMNLEFTLFTEVRYGSTVAEL